MQSSSAKTSNASTAKSQPPQPATFMQPLLMQTFTAILWVDSHYRICWANPSAEQLFVASRSRLLNKDVLQLLQTKPQKGANNAPKKSKHNSQPADIGDSQSSTSTWLKQKDITQLQAQFGHALLYQQPFISHDQLIYGMGQEQLVDYSVTPADYQKQPYFIIEIWEKDRQSRISQEQRQQEQHDIARQMLRAVAHEVKNPLAGIRGAAQLLGKQVAQQQLTDNKIQTYADIIISETDRLTQLIGQMLGSNRLANWQPINIHEPLEHVLTLTHTQHPQILMVRDYDLSLPELMADKDQLIQVFLNLINNAMDALSASAQPPHSSTQTTYSMSTAAHTQPDSHTTAVPTLTIRTRVVFQHTIGNIQHKQVLQVSVNDNGCGIDPQLIGQIFFPLVTGRANGTGLGLSLVQDMVARHHGSIDVISEVGDTTFTIHLPFAQPQDNA